jgi:hypothetical protein
VVVAWVVVVVTGGGGAAVVGGGAVVVDVVDGALVVDVGVDVVVGGTGGSGALGVNRVMSTTTPNRAATIAARIIVRPASVLYHGVVPLSASSSVMDRSILPLGPGIVRRAPDGGESN